MSVTWNSNGDVPPETRVGVGGWLRFALRALILAVLVFGGFAILLILRLLEGPLFGARRPVTPHLTRFVCRQSLRIVGLRLERQGLPMRDEGAVVANHSSWLDIFVLNASDTITFVSKAEVARWPGIGWLAQGTGTMFIARDRSAARTHTEALRTRLSLGQRLLFFPEGTSTDGQQVLSFKTTLFAAFLDPALQTRLKVQPVSVIYHAPKGEDLRFYGWWGDMSFGAHLVSTLAARRPGRVQVVYHAPLLASDYPDRKALARACETLVRQGHEEALAI